MALDDWNNQEFRDPNNLMGNINQRLKETDGKCYNLKCNLQKINIFAQIYTFYPTFGQKTRKMGGGIWWNGKLLRKFRNGFYVMDTAFRKNKCFQFLSHEQLLQYLGGAQGSQGGVVQAIVVKHHLQHLVALLAGELKVVHVVPCHAR